MDGKLWGVYQGSVMLSCLHCPSLGTQGWPRSLWSLQTGLSSTAADSILREVPSIISYLFLYRIGKYSILYNDLYGKII